MQVKLSTASQAVATLFMQENPDTTELCLNGRINLSNTSFNIRLVEAAKTLGLDVTLSAEEIWLIVEPLFEVHSRVVVHADETHITITPAKNPTQVRLRPDTSAILVEACRTSGLKKVDVLHQAIRDFHLRLNAHE